MQHGEHDLRNDQDHDDGLDRTPYEELCHMAPR